MSSSSTTGATTQNPVQFVSGKSDLFFCRFCRQIVPLITFVSKHPDRKYSKKSSEKSSRADFVQSNTPPWQLTVFWRLASPKHEIGFVCKDKHGSLWPRGILAAMGLFLPFIMARPQRVGAAAWICIGLPEISAAPRKDQTTSQGPPDTLILFQSWSLQNDQWIVDHEPWIWASRLPDPSLIV